MSEQGDKPIEHNWKPSEAMQRLAEKMGRVIPGSESIEPKPVEKVEEKIEMAPVEITTQSFEPKVETKRSEEKVVETPEKPWNAELSLIDRIADPKLQRERRTKWLFDNLGNNNIPFNTREEQLNKINQDFDESESKKNKENVSQNVETKKERDFSNEEETKIIQNCLDQVFKAGRSNEYEIKKALLGGEGFIAVELKHGEEVPLDAELLKKIDTLGLDNWIAMRNMVGRWSAFKDMDEIKPSSLTLGLFMDANTEKFFASSKCVLPYTNEATGRLELKEVDLGDEIGKAMKTLRNYFDGSVNFLGVEVEEGNRKPIEYWRLIGADLAEKDKLYTDLKLNRYVGEVAFSLLLSYQMLTDTSADDYLLMMVQQAKGRTKKYTISEDRDPFVRMLVQEDLANGKKPFTSFSGDDYTREKEKMEERVAKLLPNQLIPTGLSGDGMNKLKAGEWLKWRVDKNIFTRTQLDTAKARGGELKPATDQGTRLDMMRTALTMLTLIKEIQDPASDINKLSTLTGRLYSHMKSSFGDAYWLKKQGDNMMVPADFALKNDKGVLEDMELRDWISRTMLGVDKAFMYTHSIADHKNSKPWNMWEFAKNAEQLFKMEVQSGKGSFVGMSKEKIIEHRRELKNYINRLWKNCFDMIYKLNSKANPDSYPDWYSQGVSASEGTIDAAKKSAGSLTAWDRASRDL